MAGIATHQAAVMGAIGTATRSMDELAGHLTFERKAISTAAAKLIQRGYLERLEAGVYQLTDDGRSALSQPSAKVLTSAPHRGRKAYRTVPDSLRQRIWNAIRLNSNRFTGPQVLMLAANEADKNAAETTRRFIHHLMQTGYVVQLPARAEGSAPTSNGHKVWRLARDTGAKAPRFIAAKKAFMDQNTREVFPCVK